MLRQSFVRIFHTGSHHIEGCRYQFGDTSEIFRSHCVEFIYDKRIIDFMDHVPAPCIFLFVTYKRRYITEDFNLSLGAICLGDILRDGMNPLDHSLTKYRIEYAECAFQFCCFRDNIGGTSCVEFANGKSDLIKSGNFSGHQFLQSQMDMDCRIDRIDTVLR